MVKGINDIDIKKFSYISINLHSNTLHIINNAFFDSSTISGIFGVNYESKDTNKIFLPLPTACIFQEGDSYLDMNEYLSIQNNEEIFGINNIFFKLTSNENLDSFICILYENHVIVDYSNCMEDYNAAQKVYRNLPDGTYTFQVIATKSLNTTYDNNIDTETQIETVPFNFYIRTGEHDGV